jgi:hypothetical protein
VTGVRDATLTLDMGVKSTTRLRSIETVISSAGAMAGCRGEYVVL